jgi:hypothetical protein
LACLISACQSTLDDMGDSARAALQSARGLRDDAIPKLKKNTFDPSYSSFKPVKIILLPANPAAKNL